MNTPSILKRLLDDANFAGDLEECDNRKLLWLAMQTKGWRQTPILSHDAAILAEVENRLFPEYDGDKVKATEWGWDVCGGEVRYAGDYPPPEPGPFCEECAPLAVTTTCILCQFKEEMTRRHEEYSKALNRRVDVENVLAAVAAGKREPLTREECKALAQKLGNA